LKKPLISALLTVAAVATLAVPAGAAVPRTPATQTLPCNDGSGKSAQVWSGGGKLAAKNPCRTQWVDLRFDSFASGSYPNGELELAPGAHFNWTKKQTFQYTAGSAYLGASLLSSNDCAADWVYSYKDVRDPATAGC